MQRDTPLEELFFYVLLWFVSGYLPNGIEAVEAMLATASLGAVWSSTSPDFGVAVSAVNQSIDISSLKPLSLF